ncbi:hypothetical protein SPSINT_2086 [Staphylococcus pseudintermedius HKU10-03]|nr:hypothetical protein SPSINT_2086 [Staphylococcus pseudintermedius HKU10-03]ADX75722.1 hypothetical protein SPSE_0380 [Staphylococcus pseudintermedius ED99]
MKYLKFKFYQFSNIDKVQNNNCAKCYMCKAIIKMIKGQED